MRVIIWWDPVRRAPTSPCGVWRACVVAGETLDSDRPVLPGSGGLRHNPHVHVHVHAHVHAHVHVHVICVCPHVHRRYRACDFVVSMCPCEM